MTGVQTCALPISWLDETTKLETYLLAELEEVEFRTPLFARLIVETKTHISETFFNRDFFISHEDAEIRQFSADVLSGIAETSPNWEKFSIFIPKKDEDLAIVAYDAVLRLKQKRLQELIVEAKKGLASDNAFSCSSMFSEESPFLASTISSCKRFCFKRSTAS